MTEKEIVQKIFGKISREIEVFNFKGYARNKCFIRGTSTAMFIYDLFIYTRTNIKTGAKGFQIEPYLWVNVKEIEKYYNEVTTNTELKKETDFKTLGNSIANLLANPDGINRERNQSLGLYIFEENHINLVADELLKQFKSVAIPYFLINNTVSRVDELANKHPKEYCVHLYNDLFRFIKGLIAAKLNKNQKLEELLQIYESLIIERDMPDYCREEMSRLKSVLPMIGTSISI